MENTFNTFRSNKVFFYSILVLIVIVSLFFLAKTATEVKTYRTMNSNAEYSNTITVSGESTRAVVPDTAEFSFTVSEKNDDVATAQSTAAEKSDDIITFLKEQGIEDRDIKTTGYNIHPSYKYVSVPCRPGERCPTNSELDGYEVRQTISVKVRDISQAGDLLSGVGQRGVSNVSGLAFTVENEEAVRKEIRDEAIEDAKQEAERLARSLGVNLDTIVRFSEDGHYPTYRFEMSEQDMATDDGASVAPNIPQGENEIVSNVSITYAIR